jgi:hypothetical protein
LTITWGAAGTPAVDSASPSRTETAHRLNTVTGGRTGIGVVADAVDTTGMLHGDLITDTRVAPVRAIDCYGYTATAIVQPQ